jgi:sugar O-acyltransferase (sialic acid O-acetyltransferase NeuD family)
VATLPDSFLIWGAGGHGKVVADLVRARGHTLAGYIDRDPSKLGTVAEPGGAQVVIAEQELLELLRAGQPLPANAGAVALGIGNNAARNACVRSLIELRVMTPPLIHPSATVSPSACFGHGTVVFAGAVVNANAAVHQAVIVNSAAVVEHDCVLHEGVHVSPGAVLTGGVEVGAMSWVGAGAIIIPGIRVGAGATVGAGAVVIRHVPDGATVAGNPAALIKKKSE